MPQIVFETPLGLMRAVEDGGYLTYLDFIKEGELPESLEESPLLMKTREEVMEYFAGKRKDFTIPLKPKGTGFQKEVWDALCEIPYGQTRSYAQIAARVNRPRAFRAVGGANHNNPISIIIPCHRVIGASGKLTGYGGGLPRKEALLEMEAKP